MEAAEGRAAAFRQRAQELRGGQQPTGESPATGYDRPIRPPSEPTADEQREMDRREAHGQFIAQLQQFEEFILGNEEGRQQFRSVHASGLHPQISYLGDWLQQGLINTEQSAEERESSTRQRVYEWLNLEMPNLIFRAGITPDNRLITDNLRALTTYEEFLTIVRRVDRWHEEAADEDLSWDEFFREIFEKPDWMRAKQPKEDEPGTADTGAPVPPPPPRREGRPQVQETNPEDRYADLAGSDELAQSAAVETTPAESSDDTLLAEAIEEVALRRGRFHRIFHKSFGEVVKEAVLTGTASSLIRMGLVSSTGAAGVVVPIVTGAAIGGGKEWFSQVNANWQRKKEEKSSGLSAEEAAQIRLNKRERIKGLVPTKKGALVYATARGAVGGAIGGWIGYELLETPVGDFVKEGFHKLGQLKDLILSGEAFSPASTAYAAELSQAAPPAEPSPTPENRGQLFHNIGSTIHNWTGWGIDQTPPAPTAQPEPATAGAPPAPPDSRVPAPESGHIIQAGPNSPEIKVPDNLPPDRQWMLDANDIKKDYGLMKQAEVGRILPMIDEFLQKQGITEANPNYAALRDQLIGVAEVKINQVYDGHLEEAVAKRMSLDMVYQTWHQDFGNWAGSAEMGKSMTDSLQALQAGIVQIDQVAGNPASIQGTIPATRESLNQYLGSYLNSDEAISRNAGAVGAHIAVNHEVLNESWRKIHPGVEFPVHIGEINYIVNMAINNDPVALQRLKLAFSGLTPEQKLTILSQMGIRNIWEILAKLK